MVSTNDESQVFDEPTNAGLDQGQAAMGIESTQESDPDHPDGATHLAERAGEVAGIAGAVASTGSIAAATTAACLTSGCIIASMTAAGSVLGASAAAGPVFIAGAPAYVGAKAINRLAFKEGEEFDQEENQARASARRATGIGALGGVFATGAISLSNGFSTSAVVARLVSVGALAGGGSMTGAVLLALLPIATAGALGGAVYGIASTQRQRHRAQVST